MVDEVNIMIRPEYKKQLKPFAQSLRKNMTPEEKHLWYDFLRKMPLTAKRQQCIGDYIVDFYIDSKKIVIELDGSQHYNPDGIEQDATRDAFLSDRGLTVLRYTNLQIHENFEGVCEDIARHCGIPMADIHLKANNALSIFH